jgi:hypothetical protein
VSSRARDTDSTCEEADATRKVQEEDERQEGREEQRRRNGTN